jgi:hypothetical protein
MAFRQNKSDAHHRRQAFERWHALHLETLVNIGLPPSVHTDEDHWLAFLENGHLHWHEDPWRFEFGQLSSGQLAALHRFLEGEYGQSEQCPPLLRWLRVRMGI